MGSLVFSSFADRIGRMRMLRPVATTGLALVAVAGLSPTYWIFVAIFALVRPLLTATSTLVAVVTVEVSTPSNRARHLAWIAAGAGIGGGLASVLHGLLPGETAFRWLFASALIPALAIRPLLARIREPEAHFRRREHLAHIGRVPREFRGRLLVVAVVAVVINVITGPANGFAFVYAENVLKISRHEVTLVVTASAITGLAGLVLGRWCSDRLGRRWTVAIGTVGYAVTATLAYSDGQTAFISMYMVGVLAAAVLAPAIAALTTEIFPHFVRATVGGWFVVAGVLGALIGILFFGWVGDVVNPAVTIEALRVPAVVTFLPLLPLLLLLRTLPESRGVEID
jgi:MFS family permease